MDLEAGADSEGPSGGVIYTALHDDLTIRQSPIHGLGVFATATIPAGTVLGISHIADQANGRYHCGFIRTPLGGFINHSDVPNSTKIGVVHLDGEESYIPLQGRETSTTMALRTTREIMPGEEVTVFYTIYNLSPGVADLTDDRARVSIAL